MLRKDILLWLYDLESNSSKHKKNVQKSEELRKNGNEAFQNKKYTLSIKYYTLSLQHAPWKSNYFSLAIANRSAALYYLKNYEVIKLAFVYNKNILINKNFFSPVLKI